jgi:hypothetical protein
MKKVFIFIIALLHIVTGAQTELDRIIQKITYQIKDELEGKEVKNIVGTWCSWLSKHIREDIFTEIHY